MKIQITKMESILIHISELGTWVSTSNLNIDLGRIIDVKTGDYKSFMRLLDAYGNIRTSEPEAYIVVRLKNNWRQCTQKASISFAGSKASLGLDSVSSFQALTDDAQVRLNSQTERLSINLSSPEFISLWREFQSQFQLQEARESGASFLSLYTFPDVIEPSLLDISDSLLSGLLARISDYKSERTLEGLKGFAEFGPTEFGMRISSAFSEEWRITDERYVRFRNIRSEKLSKKSWNDTSYLDFSDLRDSIASFDEESRKVIGLPPLAAASYFKFYAEFIMQGNKLNLEGVNKTASSMLSLGYIEDCFNFIFILGSAIGAEQVAAIKYKFFKDRFSVFNQNHFTKSHETLDVNLFKITPAPDIVSESTVINPLDNSAASSSDSLVNSAIGNNAVVEKLETKDIISSSDEDKSSSNINDSKNESEKRGLSGKDTKKDHFSEKNNVDLNITISDKDAAIKIGAPEETVINVGQDSNPSPLSTEFVGQQALISDVNKRGIASNMAKSSAVANEVITKTSGKSTSDTHSDAAKKNVSESRRSRGKGKN